jgi:hypothetical protein
VDGKTGAAVPWGNRDRVALLLDREGGIAVLPLVVRAAESGVLEVRRYRQVPREGEAEGPEAEAWRKARAEIRVAGYARREFESASALEGERTIPLEAIAPAVAGRVTGSDSMRTGLRIALEPVPSAGAKPPPREFAPLGGLRGEDGSFAFYEVSSGTWRLEVRVLPQGPESARAFRVFEKGEGPVDLGEIPLERPCTVRARVVARDGTPVLDEDMVIRPADGGDADEVGGDDMDEQGWVVFRGLAPGTRYMVFASLEGVEGEVFTPPRPGEESVLELRWDNQGTRCRLDFTVKGRPPVEWGEMCEGPALDAGAWKKDGFLEHDMAPGDYLFGFLAKAPGDAEPKRYWGKFTVPERILWDAVIDLKESLDE